MKTKQKIANEAYSLLDKNPGGLTFDELYNRLDNVYGNGRTLNRKLLFKIIGVAFKQKKINYYELDKQRVFQLKKYS